MLNRTTSLVSVTLTALLAACSTIPQEAYYNRGAPESLLDTSSEVVNISLEDPAATEDLTSWINQEQPTRADLICNEGDTFCDKARSVLDQFKVPVQQKPAGSVAMVALHYEHVVARDCENRYIDNSINPYNLYHPTFGCSIAANIVQHVTDKRQFVNPNLLEYPDAEKAVQVYRSYETQAPAKPLDSSSAVSGGSSSAGGSSGGS